MMSNFRQQLLPSVAARAAPQAEKPAGEPDLGAGPKNDQPSLVKLDDDDAVRVRADGAGEHDPPALGRSQCDAGRLDGAHVAVKLSSIVAEGQKNIGKPVKRGDDPPVDEHPFARFFQNYLWRRIAKISWIDFFESKSFGASFGGLVSVATLQMAGANSHSTFALTLLIVVSYWLIFDKPR